MSARQDVHKEFIQAVGWLEGKGVSGITGHLATGGLSRWSFERSVGSLIWNHAGAGQSLLCLDCPLLGMFLRTKLSVEEIRRHKFRVVCLPECFDMPWNALDCPSTISSPNIPTVQPFVDYVVKHVLSACFVPRSILNCLSCFAQQTIFLGPAPR